MTSLARRISVRCGMSVLLLTALLCLPTGCASMISGKMADVRIKPVSADTVVQVDGEVIDMPADGPAELELTRADAHVVRFERPGYHPVEVTIRRKGNSAVGWNLLLLPPVGTVIGLAIDNKSGASFDLEPREVLVQMQACVPGKRPYTILAN